MTGHEPLDRGSPTPLHQQLEEVIKERIAEGEWTPRTQIPSENELSATYGLSRMTTRAVISRLTVQGLLYRVPGKGTFVAEPKIANTTSFPLGIQRQLEAQGIKTKARPLSLAQLQASGTARRELRLEPGTLIWRLERLRTINDEPISIHLSYIPVQMCPDLDKKDLSDGHLRDVLENQYELIAEHVNESVETALASERDAALLGVEPGFTLLQLQETSSDREGIPFEFCHVLFRGDKMKIRFQFSQSTALADVSASGRR
ncbi:MAG: GntR family transcriptional regulator [Propionibacteriaceae bacterium]|jgi:GntR family transcriptional regulator|nr:GntR family transcriptional regulator [Propionibacteriaceae bacterium]